MVLPNQLRQFLADAQGFRSVFKSPSSISFWEISDVKINLPFDEDDLISPTKRMLSKFRRPIGLAKFSSWEDRMDLTDFMADVGRLGQGLSEVRTLALVYNHFGAQEDDEDEDTVRRCLLRMLPSSVTIALVVQLPPWELWYDPRFFDNVKMFADLVCLKLRTALEVFPVVTGLDPRQAQEAEEHWVVQLGQTIPNLRRIHIGHSYSEQLGHEGSPWYSGERVVRYRGTAAPEWSSGCWFYPVSNSQDPFYLGQKRALFNPRTTEKIHFDPWGSDSEYEECQEDGW